MKYPKLYRGYRGDNWSLISCMEYNANSKTSNFNALNNVVDSLRWELEIKTKELLAAQEELRKSRQVEVTLQASERQFAALVQTLPIGIFRSNIQGYCLYVNQRWCQISGLTFQQAQQDGWVQALHPHDRERVFTQWYRCVQDELPFQAEYRFIRPDGVVTWVYGQAIPERGLKGELTGYLGSITDVNESKLVEEALRESEAKYRSVVVAMREGIVLQDTEGQIITCNESAERILGLTREQIIGRTSSDPNWYTIHENGSPFPGETHPAMVTLRTGEPTSNVVMGVHKPDGELSWILINSQPLFKPGETRPYAVATSFSDITRRKEAEEKNREQAALLDITSDAIFVQDIDNRIVFWNQGAERLYGWQPQEVLGRNADELFIDESSQMQVAIKTALESGSWQGELNKVTKNGRHIIIFSRWTLMRDALGNPKSFLTVNSDITNKKQLELQFYRTQRLESLGTLASGIAHDLNNILTPILAIAQLLPLKLNNLDQRSQEMLKILENNSKRGADMVKQILTFARGHEGIASAVDVKHLLADIYKIIRGTFPKSIEVSIDIAPDLLIISVDITQIHQILMNLCVNARDAMVNGGKLMISAQNIFIDENYAKMSLDAKVGNYVVITIADTGVGIAPENIDKIFDPFFTTKEIGKGTGLGLSTVLGLVKNNHGFIEVSSIVHQGSQFKVYLPIADKQTPQQQEDIELIPGNGELILVVDDESAIRQVAQHTLESFNYDVITASDGIEALAIYVQNKNKIKLILIDMMMPSMDGVTAIQALQRMNPKVPIIAMSGLTSTEVNAKSVGAKGFLTKPFTSKNLLNTFNQVFKKNGDDS